MIQFGLVYRYCWGAIHVRVLMKEWADPNEKKVTCLEANCGGVFESSTNTAVTPLALSPTRWL